MYQRVGATAYKADLSNTIKLAQYLNNPQCDFKTIHVAGTNGKGSTSHMLASVLQEAGYKVGLYTSPHLKDFRERIKINGIMIPKKTVTSFVERNRSFFETNQLSFFEMTVGLAFAFFKKEKVDIAVIEVGMGGRLDSTNIITPEISIITNIGYDHTQFLGYTLQKIAFEKAGIIKAETPVIIGETQPDTEQVFNRIASERNAPIFFADNKKVKGYTSDLKGNYQVKNKRTVLTALKVLKEKGWNVSENNIENGLKNTIKNTGLMGRWQQLKATPKVICDTAHNKEGLIEIMKQIKTESFKKLHIVLGVVNDKDLQNVLPLFPEDATYYFCKPDVPRGLDAQILHDKAKEFNLEGNIFSSVNNAYNEALKEATEKDFIYVGGSTFVVAEVV